MDKSPVEQLIEEIMNPADDYTPVPFWFLNDELDKGELKRQLLDFKEKGVNGVVLHPRIGMPDSISYLSETFFQYIEYSVQVAAEHKMSIVLYDEGMYPSGSAHGEVVRENPQLASIGITLTGEPKDRKVITALENGQYIVQDFTGGTIRGIHFGEDDGEAGAPPSADILNPLAVRRFIELTHDRYYDRLKDYFGSTIIGFFTDEPCVLGRNTDEFFPWTEGLGREILANGGKLEELDALFRGEENGTVKCYQSILRKRLNDVYYRSLSTWCAQHRIALMGHPEASDDIDEEVYFHIPGQDLIMRRVSPEGGGLLGLDSVQAKCSSDAARHLVRRRNSNECFGVCSRPGNPWHFTGGDMKWFIDWLGVRGVNMFIPHAFYYSLRGKRKEERPPDVGPNAVWWKHYKRFSDYMKRVSYIMTDSINCAKVAVLCGSGDMPDNVLAPFYENQVEFNYIPRSILSQAKMDEGGIHIGEYTYPYFVSNDKMKLPAKRITSWREVRERDFIPDVPCKDLRVSHLIKNGVHLYFFTNESEEKLNLSGSMPVSGRPIGVDLWEGKCWLMNSIRITNRMGLQFCLERRESLLVVFDPEASHSYSGQEEVQMLDLDFQLLSHENTSYTKVYEAGYICGIVTGNEAVQVYGKEMLECYCNGKFVGVSFWNPHFFKVGEWLNTGSNTIRLTVTGSTANKYTDGHIPYGLEVENL